MATVVALSAGGSNAELDRPGAEKGSSRSASAVSRAQLTVHAPDDKGKPGATIDTITLQFNPTSVTVNKSAGWSKDALGRKGAPAQYTSWQGATLGFTVFLDATSNPGGSVVAMVERLQACCLPTEQSATTDKPVPPLVVLHWGSVTSFPAFVTSANATYSLFAADGLPIRATCVVELTEMWSAEPRQNPTSGSEAVRRVHRTVAGDTLASVAYAEYGDPACWRPLAAWNGIDDPLRISVGTLLQLPSARELLATDLVAP